MGCCGHADKQVTATMSRCAGIVEASRSRVACRKRFRVVVEHGGFGETPGWIWR